MSVPGSRILSSQNPNPADLAAMGARTAGLDAGTGGKLMRQPRSVLLGNSPERLLTSNPRRVGAYIFNAGGKLELPLDLGAGLRGQAALPLQQFVDSAGIAVPSYALSSYKAFYLRITTQLTKGAASQATGQLVVGRGPWSPAAGNATGVGGNNDNTTKGAVVNLGVNAATLGPGIFVLSPADIADLQWPHPYVGLELNLGGALTAGAAQLYLDMPLGPALLLGLSDQISDQQGPTANTFLMAPQTSPLFVPTDRELWGMATQGGLCDVRIWEVFYGEAAAA